MTLRHSILAVLLAIGGLGVSFLVIPRNHEIALMRFKDKRFDEARRAYEKQVEAGDYSSAVVAPLTQLYLQYGDVNAAIALVEKFVQKHPRDVEARLRLGTYFQYAERQDAYLKNLEELGRRAPAENVLRELSQAYNFTGQYGKQVAALRALLAINDSNPKDYLDLAYLQASQKQIADAATTLEHLVARHPRAVTPEVQDLFIHLLIDAGRAEEARVRAAQWLGGNPRADRAALFAEILEYKGHPELALELLRPLDKMVDTDPVLLTRWLQSQLVLGHRDTAYMRLKDLYRKRRLPTTGSVPESFLGLALDAKERGLAFEAARTTDLRALPNNLQVYLAESAWAEKRMDFLNYMRSELGEGFLAPRPSLAAEWALARGDKTAMEHWLSRAAGAKGLKADEKIALVVLYQKVGRPNEAALCLRQLAADDGTPPAALVEVARLYLQMGRPADGLAQFEELRRRRSSPQVGAGWALLATATGPEGPVVNWLHGVSDQQLSEDVLKDLYFVANDHRRQTLALAFAQRLYQRHDGAPERQWLGNALTATGRPAEALPYLRSFSPTDVEARSTYEAALRGAFAGGEPVETEFRRYWNQRLSDTNLTDAHKQELAYALLDVKAYEVLIPTLREFAHQKKDEAWLHAYANAAIQTGRQKELVSFLEEELKRRDLPQSAKETRLYILMDRGGPAAALPSLRRFAEDVGGAWVFAYEEALIKLGRREETLEFLKAQAKRTDLTTTEKRGLAFRLLEAGQKKIAENLFLDLAQQGTAASPDVSQLLFVWGPRPRAAALDWLESRARSSAGKAGGEVELAQWMRHLINAGAAQRALTVGAGHLPPPGTGGTVLDAYLEALVAAKQGETLAATVNRELTVERNPDRLRRLAQRSLELNQGIAARQVFARLLEVAPQDREALRQTGTLEFAAGNFEEARRCLSQYLGMGEGDSESRYYYGQLLERARDRSGAQAQYEQALRQIEKVSPQPFSSRVLRAQLLYRSGRKAESFAAFEVLLTERPKDKSLRADYTSLLVEQGRYQVAQRVLSGEDR